MNNFSSSNLPAKNKFFQGGFIPKVQVAADFFLNLDLGQFEFINSF